MSSFKGDHNYRVYHDEGGSYWEDTASEEEEAPVEVNTLSKWVDAHYDVLAELFEAFKANGRQVFGRVFFQLGGFHEFTHFLHRHTLGASSDLLKAK